MSLMARVTLQTLAEQLGVSRMTVSNAFSARTSSRLICAPASSPRRTTSVTSGRIRPRVPPGGTTGAVGVLLTDSLAYTFTDDVATSFLGAVVDELAATGLALTLLPSDERDDVVPARDVALDGALVYSCKFESAARDWLVRRKLPLVFVDQDPVAGIASVNVDDRAGARAAAQHLVDLGHRRVGIVTVTVDGPRGILEDPLGAAHGHPQKQRLLGWFDALEGAGAHPTVVQAQHNDDAEANTAAALLLAAAPRPTAVLCFSDVLALGVVRVAGDLGLRVPDDLSVVGFDDSPVGRQCTPM